MSPIGIHHKGSKRKPLGPVEFLLETEVYQKDADAHEQEKPKNNMRFPVLESPYSPHHLSTGRKLRPGALKRQVENPLPNPSTRTAAALLTPTSISATINEPTPFNNPLPTHSTSTLPPSSFPTLYPSQFLFPSPTATSKPDGQNPITSIAVQLILGVLAAICFLSVFVRCFHVNRQHQSVIEARRRNLAAAHAPTAVGHANGGETSLAPTNEMTLAARLHMYQAQADRQNRYPYQQRPFNLATSGHDGGEGVNGALGSVNSFVAPSYEQDVSPPPFMTTLGKPPAYAEIINVDAARPRTPSNPSLSPQSNSLNTISEPPSDSHTHNISSR